MINVRIMNYELRELRIMKNAGRKERKGITQRTQRKNAEERGGELITNYELRITGITNYEKCRTQRAQRNNAKNAEEERGGTRRGINYKL
jgi:hypothetical protein